jgi:hypothetical protein
MLWTVARLFVRFVHGCGVCLWCDVQDRLAGRCLDWRLRDVVRLCWEDFTMRVLLCWRASQYDRRMRRFRRVKGVK